MERVMMTRMESNASDAGRRTDVSLTRGEGRLGVIGIPDQAMACSGPR
jgi:hypothetical protein